MDSGDVPICGLASGAGESDPAGARPNGAGAMMAGGGRATGGIS